MTALIKIEKQNFSIDKNSIFHEQFLASCTEYFGAENTQKWLSLLKIFVYENNELILSAPSKFIRDWVVREFLDNKNSEKNLLQIASKIDVKIKKINIITDRTESTQNIDATTNIAEKKIVNLSKHDNVFSFGLELNPKFNFTNFISVRYNKLALAMAEIAAGAKNTQAGLFDTAIPLYIHGGIGMGKTHLAQAIAWQIKENHPNKKAVYLSAHDFMYHFVDSVRNNKTMDFKTKFRTVDVLIIDDMQFFAGKQGTQEEFLHIFNLLVENNKQVVMVCDRSPSDLEAIDEKLKSRISGGMVLNFNAPDFNDRLAILKIKSQAICEKFAISEKIDDKILELLATKINSSIRDLEGSLTKLLTNKLLANEPITIDSARSIALEYSKNIDETIISLEKVEKIITNHYEIKLANLHAKTRAKHISRPRQIAMYLAKNWTKSSLPEIGRFFGNKNHATVIYAVKSVQKEIDADAKFAVEIKSLEEKLQG